MKGSAYSTLAVPTTAVPIPLTLHSIFLVHLAELCKQIVWPLFLGYKLVNPWLYKVYREIPSVLMSTALGLRPRAVLISTSGIFPVYLLKPWVNLYIQHVAIKLSSLWFAVFLAILRFPHGSLNHPLHLK